MERSSSFDLDYAHVVFAGKKTARKLCSPIMQVGTGRTVDRRLPEREPTQSERDLLCWLFKQAGLDHERYRWQPLLRRIGACLRSLRVESVSEAQAAIERNPRLMAKAIDAMVIGTTGFFRDPDVFACLREHILPELTAIGHGIDVWSAACSDGAELYSVGMILGDLGRCGGRLL